MGSRGQSARGSVAHHLAGSTSAFRQLATEGEAQFVSRSTFEGPLTTVIGCEEGSGAAITALWARPRSCNLVQSQRRIAEGEGAFQAVTESACRAREGPRGRRGFTRQPENSKRAHLSAPALQTPKFRERGQQEREKRMKTVAGRGTKKREILGPHPSGPRPWGPHPLWSKNSTSKNWPKSKLAEVDRAPETPPEAPPGDLQVGRGEIESESERRRGFQKGRGLKGGLGRGRGGLE